MAKENSVGVITENQVITSVFLKRDVKVDCYLPAGFSKLKEVSLLLINDGQDLVTMHFEEILEELYDNDMITPVLCVGLHCSSDRKNEYGTAKILDYKGRGARAGLYTSFIFKELLPFLRETYSDFSFTEKAFAGFSLGGLCAMDIVWNHPSEFTLMGAFSGSFWWRDVGQDEEQFDENLHRIMHRQVREGGFYPWLKFFFEVGTQDETSDRNNNGIIDSIDDTLDLIMELNKKGYPPSITRFLELKDGRHDVPTWAMAFPYFLLWGWGKLSTNGR